MLTWPESSGPVNMILDDGGDATMLVLRGAEFETAGVVPPGRRTTPPKYKVFLNLLRESLKADPTRGPGSPSPSRGVTEETTTGVHGSTSSPRPVS